MESIQIDYSQIDYTEVDGINYSDYPDFCDAYISRAWWKDGREFTDDELDALNEDGSYVYEQVFNQVF